MKTFGNILLSILMVAFAIHTAHQQYVRNISLHQNGIEKTGVVYSSVPRHNGSLKSANGTWRTTIEAKDERIELVHSGYLEPGIEIYYLEDPSIAGNIVYGQKAGKWYEYIPRSNGGMGIIALLFIGFLGLCGLVNLVWAVQALNKAHQSRQP